VRARLRKLKTAMKPIVQTLYGENGFWEDVQRLVGPLSELIRGHASVVTVKATLQELSIVSWKFVPFGHNG